MYSAMRSFLATLARIASSFGKAAAISGALASNMVVISKTKISAQVNALPTANPSDPYMVASFSTLPAPLAPWSAMNALKAVS